MKAFAGGMVVAVVVRNGQFRSVAVTKISTFLIMGCIAAAVMVFADAQTSMAVLLLFLAFTLVAGGNTLFGLLVNHAPHVLAGTSYSIYCAAQTCAFSCAPFFVWISCRGSVERNRTLVCDCHVYTASYCNFIFSLSPN